VHRATDGTLNTDSVVADLKAWNDSTSATTPWMQKIKDGYAFDKERAKAYDFNQIYVVKPSGKGYFRLDSYDPFRNMIVSRKYTQFASISETTGQKYVDELAYKYPNGATIANVPSNQQLLQSGSQLQGELYLEVPVQTSPIPQSILDRAAVKRVKIVDVNGKIYN
jgi:filamentous hemagglutinin